MTFHLRLQKFRFWSFQNSYDIQNCKVKLEAWSSSFLCTHTKFLRCQIRFYIKALFFDALELCFKPYRNFEYSSSVFKPVEAVILIQLLKKVSIIKKNFSNEFQNIKKIPTVLYYKNWNFGYARFSRSRIDCMKKIPRSLCKNRSNWCVIDDIYHIPISILIKKNI